ncbi:Mu transposase C-terminal domain-containing protein [uncultured Lamprocystis sp.]|jgi:putative transposase|uniref:Mu transposase C-terminal domain-containing protein n=1 Tax=uncultured Lamprocystis sp. TaxID=543132 RepID=UPI0025FE4048|nr:Mu transposase C-terminal domain-containing protein [uncultured Lamprocystis sp.]
MNVVPLRPTMQELIPAAAPATDRLVSPKAGAKRRLCEHVLGLAGQAGTVAAATGIALFEAAWAAGTLPADVRAAAAVVRPQARDCPDRATLYRWLEQYRRAQKAGSLTALDPQYQGRARALTGWEARALHLYQQPSKPAAAEVARQLREEGQAATETAVRRYLASLPSHVLTQGRLGPRLRQALHGDYVQRTTEGLPAGHCYVGDGHTIDVYLRHPTGHHPYRPELTVWLDWRSRCVAGWWLSDAESGLTTLFSLSHTIRRHNHVPAFLHIDNGSGFKAQIQTDEATGFFARLGITPMFALPYNARSKIVERFFRTLEDSFGKRWPSYCGRDRDDEARADLLKRFKRDPSALPTVDQYKEGLAAWIAGYEAEAHPEERAMSKTQVWAQSFVASPPGPGEGLWWPRVERVVNRRRVMLDGRTYKHPALDAYTKTDLRDGRVWVEYDVHDDRSVRVLQKDGRWICDASLVVRRPALSPSRVEDGAVKREAAALKRLEAHAQEIRDRAALTVDAAQTLDAIEAQTGEVSLLALELARGEIGALAPQPEALELDIWGAD